MPAWWCPLAPAREASLGLIRGLGRAHWGLVMSLRLSGKTRIPTEGPGGHCDARMSLELRPSCHWGVVVLCKGCCGVLTVVVYMGCCGVY